VGVVLSTGIVHAGDALDAGVEDADRAWITFDTLVGEGHGHLVTVNGGRSWEKVSWRPTLRASA
jgi:hypothetical protein